MARKKSNDPLLDEPLIETDSDQDGNEDEEDTTNQKDSDVVKGSDDLVFSVKARANSPVEERVRIIIERQEGSDGTMDVPVAVNGRVYLIKRGYPVEVPKSVVEVLQHAVVSKLIKNDAGEEVMLDMPRFVWRYL